MGQTERKQIQMIFFLQCQSKFPYILEELCRGILGLVNPIDVQDIYLFFFPSGSILPSWNEALGGNILNLSNSEFTSHPSQNTALLILNESLNLSSTEGKQVIRTDWNFWLRISEMQPRGGTGGDSWDILERFCTFPAPFYTSKPHLGKQRK